MSSNQAQQTIDFLENNGYVITNINHTDGTKTNMSNIHCVCRLDDVVSFDVMTLAEYEANGFQV